MIEAVTIDQLQAAIGTQAQPEAANGHETGLRWSKYAGKARGVDAYVRSAIMREGFQVALATEGERNNVLNAAAFSLGTMAAWPEMDEQRPAPHSSEPVNGQGWNRVNACSR